MKDDKLARSNVAEPSPILKDIIAPAFWLRLNGAVEFANAAGQLLLESDAAAVTDVLRAAIATPHGQLCREISVFPLASDDGPVGALVVIQEPGVSLRAAPEPSTGDGAGHALEARLSEARTAWSLTPRHLSIVRLLACGDSNKDLATKLGLSPGTVEVYLSEIFRRAKVESRLQLVAKLWT